MALLDIRGGRFLYEVMPQEFPNFLTETETMLWELYYIQKAESIKKK
jgi:hypothetical protein